MPPTPLESLQMQYGKSSTAQTTTSTASADSSKSSRLSTYSARFMELEARIARQQKDFARKDAVNSDKVNNIEQKLARLDKVEGKLTIFVRILMDRFNRSWRDKQLWRLY